MGIGEAENHGDGDGITIDDGDDNLGILWGGGTLQGRRSDTSPPATTWNVQLLHSPSQWGCSIAPVANGSPGANREVVVEAPLRLTRDHLMVKMFWENFSFPPGGFGFVFCLFCFVLFWSCFGKRKLFFSTWWFPSKQGSSPATTLRRG